MSTPGASRTVGQRMWTGQGVDANFWMKGETGGGGGGFDGGWGERANGRLIN